MIKAAAHTLAHCMLASFDFAKIASPTVSVRLVGELVTIKGKGQILRSTPNTAPLICGACNTQPEGLLTMA